AWITDMNQVLGHSAGNALEVQEALAFLDGSAREPRLLEVTRMLSAELLLIGRLALKHEVALQRVDAVLANGRALEHFARMVGVLGGPTDFCERADRHLAMAPVRRDVPAPHSGWVERIDTRGIGLAIIELGGGRRQASDAIDPRVGFSEFIALGRRVERGDALAVVHAASDAAADAACAALKTLIYIGDAAPATTPVLIESITG
ncbi:MAG: thymidine phosphorylase, partial [Rhizobacter sp.]|nr:thymidine phosphorylase [Rhizobacter sp.]